MKIPVTKTFASQTVPTAHQATAQMRIAKKGKIEGGFTLLENMFACGIVSMFMGGVFTVNTQSMGILRMGRDEAAASQVLQQRIEQMRIANWPRITDAVWARDNLLNVNADGGVGLKSITETMTVTPYNSASTGENVFTRTNGAATSASQNTSLVGETAIKVTWSVSWTGLPNGRKHTRETAAILGLGGVAK